MPSTLYQRYNQRPRLEMYMRKLLLFLGLILLVVGLAAIAGSSSYAQDDGGYHGRPPMFTPGPIEGPFEKGTPIPTGTIPADLPAFPPVSMFGMNLYLTGLERTVAQSTQV